MNLASPRLCSKLHSTPAEISCVFERIGAHVQDVVIRTPDLSSSTKSDAIFATVLKEMPNLRTLTVIYDPLDTRRHSRLLDALRPLRQLEHIALVEPPRRHLPLNWPVRLGHLEPATQGACGGVGMEGTTDTDTDSDSESGSERGDTEADPRGTAQQLGATRNLHSFRNLCLTAILQHHAPRLLSVRLQGSVPLSEHGYRRLRDTACGLQLLRLVGAFEAGSAGLVAAFMEETLWACAGRLRSLSIWGSSTSAISEAYLIQQFRLGVFGDALEEPPSISTGKVNPDHHRA